MVVDLGVWARIDRWSEANLPAVPTPREGVAADALALAAAEVGELPADYLALLRVRDGSASPVFEGWEVCDLTRAVLCWRNAAPVFRERGAAPRRVPPDGAVLLEPEYGHDRMFPFATNIFGNFLCLDLRPLDGGPVGRVLSWDHEHAPLRVLAPSFAAWLDGVADGLERGRRVYDPEWDAVRGPVRHPDPAVAEALRPWVDRLVGRVLTCEPRSIVDLGPLGVLRVSATSLGRDLHFQAAPDLWSALGGPPMPPKARFVGPPVPEAPGGRPDDAFRALAAMVLAGGDPVRVAGLGDLTVSATVPVTFVGRPPRPSYRVLSLELLPRLMARLAP